MRSFKIILFIFLFAAHVVAESHEIKIGATLPLTGRLSFLGEDIRRGMTLAFEQTSSSNIKFISIFDDNQHDAKLAGSSAKRLLEIEKVDVVISLWDMADVIAPLAERKKIPHISIRWDPGVAEKYDYTITVESTYRSYVDSLIKLLGTLNARSVSLMTEEGKGWLLAADYLQEVAAKSGVTVLRDERYLSGTSDFQTILLRALKPKPDYVLLLSNPPHTEQIIETIHKVAPNQKYTGYFEVLERPSLVDNVPFVAQFEVTGWFGEMFRNRFGSWPKGRAPQAYDIVRILAATMERTKRKPTLLAIADTVRMLSNKGAVGPLFVSGQRTIESECVWKIARNGKFEMYGGAVK